MLKTTYEDSALDSRKAAYYGKPKELVSAEKCLDRICTRIHNDKIGTLNIRMNINQSKDNVELQQHLKKQYGFKTIVLNWNSDLTPNGMTFASMGIIFDDAPNKLVSNNQSNPYFDTDHRYACTIVLNVGMIKDMELSGGETLAIILHEIGHNFDNLITADISKAFTYISIASGEGGLAERIIGLLGVYGFSKLLRERGDLLADFQNKYPVIRFLITLKDGIKYHVSAAKKMITFLRVMQGTRKYVAPDPVDVISGLLNRRGEYFADSFPVKYGYGTELSSVMYKFSHNEKMRPIPRRMIDNIPVLKTVYDVTVIPVEMLLCDSYEEHPFDENRMIAMQRDLERDYASDEVPASLKPEIKRQIDAIASIRKQDIDDTGLDIPFTKIRKLLMNWIMPDLL